MIFMGSLECQTSGDGAVERILVCVRVCVCVCVCVSCSVISDSFQSHGL